MSSTQPPKEHWFLPDRPITDPSQDEFSHVDVARNLGEMVREDQPPSIIGLLGPFGVGKSTVVELLAQQIKGSADLDIIRVSAERHSEPIGLHRTLIYAVAEALQNRELREKKDVEPLLGRIEHSHELTSVDLPNLPLLRVPRAKRTTLLQSLGLLAAVIIVWLGIVLAVAGIFEHRHYLGALKSSFAVPLAVLVGVVVGVARLVEGLVFTPLSAALTPPTITEAKPRAEAADELERVFSDLIYVGQTKRLIIAVDDVDRLAPERLLDTLHAIHSFQKVCKNPQPVFIVSCDERIVRDAIAAARPSLASRQNQLESAATAYLDRLFLHRQYVVAHPPRDMRGYARDLLSDGTHTGSERLGDSLSEVIEVLIHDGVTDPRHTIRLINAFFSDYRLAFLREGGVGRRSLRAGEVTNHPRVLARMTVLKVDFPATYSAILSDTDVLLALDKLARGEVLVQKEKALLANYLSPETLPENGKTTPAKGGQDEPPQAMELAESHAEPLEDVAGLLAYLSRTRDWFDGVDSLLPFLYISQDEIDRRLGSGEAQRIRGMLANAQTDLLSEHIRTLIEEDESAGNTSGMDGYVELADELLSGLNGIELSNARNAVIATLSVLPTAHRGRLADHIGRFVNEVGVQMSVEDAITAATAARATGSRDALMSVVLSRPEDVEAWTDKALVVAQNLTELSTVGLAQTDSTAFLIGSVTQAGNTNNLAAVQKWIHAMQAEDRAAGPDALERTLVLTYLKVLAAQPTGAPQPEPNDVDFVVGRLPSDDDGLTQVAISSKDLVNKQRLGGAFGRLATSAAHGITSLNGQNAANLVSALSHSSVVDDGSFDDDIEAGTLRRTVDLLCRFTPSTATFTVGADKVPIVSATVTLAAALVASADQIPQLPTGPAPDSALSPDDVRALCLRLYEVLVAARPDLVTPLTTTLASRWQQESGSVPTSHEWIGPVIATVDRLPQSDADRFVATLVGAVQGKTRTDASALAALPLLQSVVKSEAGVRAVPGLLGDLQAQLNAATPDAAVFAVDILQHVYDGAPSSASSAGTPGVITALSALAALNQPNVSQDGIRGLTQTHWPIEHANAGISAVSQFTAQLSSDDVRGALSLVRRARDEDIALQPLHDPLAARMIEWITVPEQFDASTAAALWRLLGEGPRAIAACVLPGLVDEKAETLAEESTDERAAEIERWIRQAISLGSGGADTRGAADSMTAIRELPDAASFGSMSPLLEEWLSGTTAIRPELCSVLLGSLDSAEREQVGTLLVGALATGKDRVLRSLETLEIWIRGTDADVVRRTLDAGNFPEWTRTWVLDQQDEDVARALRPVIEVLPPEYQRTIRDHVGRRPHGDARPIWDAVFGDRG